MEATRRQALSKIALDEKERNKTEHLKEMRATVSDIFSPIEFNSLCNTRSCRFLREISFQLHTSTCFDLLSARVSLQLHNLRIRLEL